MISQPQNAELGKFSLIIVMLLIFAWFLSIRRIARLDLKL